MFESHFGSAAGRRCTTGRRSRPFACVADVKPPARRGRPQQVRKGRATTLRARSTWRRYRRWRKANRPRIIALLQKTESAWIDRQSLTNFTKELSNAWSPKSDAPGPCHTPGVKAGTALPVGPEKDRLAGEIVDWLFPMRHQQRGRQSNGSERWKPEILSDEELWEVCRRLPSDWEPHGQRKWHGGRKPAPTATHAAGSWNSSVLRPTGERAPTRSHHVEGCSPTESKDAGNTSRRRNAAIRRPAPPAVSS